jgi:Rap1a immunity proteins
MRILVYLVAVLACVTATPAAAQFISGRELLERCQNNGVGCPAYIAAVVDVMHLVDRSNGQSEQCIPGGVKLYAPLPIVQRYLTQHSDERKIDAPLGVIMALRRAYGCAAWLENGKHDAKD